VSLGRSDKRFPPPSAAAAAAAARRLVSSSGNNSLGGGGGGGGGGDCFMASYESLWRSCAIARRGNGVSSNVLTSLLRDK